MVERLCRVSDALLVGQSTIISIPSPHETQHIRTLFMNLASVEFPIFATLPGALCTVLEASDPYKIHLPPYKTRLVWQ